MTEVNRETVASNVVWRFLERFGAQIVAFVVSIILARLLDPVVYGSVALVTVFTTIFQVFVDSGFGAALIQKKNADDLDFSTVFYFNIFVCVFLYAVMFFVAPLIAKFYDNSSLTPIIRVLSLVLIISGFKSIQSTYVSKHLLFKKFFWATLIGTLVSAVIGIYMAFKGYGVWALIAQNLINHFVDTILLWIIVRWKPKRMFSFTRLKSLFKYGSKLLASGLIDVTYNQVRALIIGKKYSSEDLAFYNRGEQIPNLAINNLNSAIDSVLLPSLSLVQDNKERVKQMLRRSISVSCFIIFPVMMGIAVCADSIIAVLLTEKWSSAVIYLQLFCLIYAFYPIHTANLNAMKAMGRSDYFLKLEIIKKVLGLGLLFGMMWISVEAIVWSLVIINFVSLIINTWPNRKILGYGFFEQMKDILPALLTSAFMGAFVYYIYLSNGAGGFTLLKQVLIGVIVYITLASLFNSEVIKYLLDFVKKFKAKKK